jgi:hypothetical protein
MSPDSDLVDRLRQMRDGFAKSDPETMLATQVALRQMTPKHADLLLAMVSDADEKQHRYDGECDWCGTVVGLSHQCSALADEDGE